MQTFCPKHFTLEDVECADPQVECPPRVALDPARHVLLTCGPCDRTRVVPVDRIMKGRVESGGTCQLDKCAATVVYTELPVDNPPGVTGDPLKGVNQAAKPRKASKAE